jgi:formylglycine-generating enzyme required for sulfatase activity
MDNKYNFNCCLSVNILHVVGFVTISLMSCQQRQSADRAISLNDKSLSCHTTAVTLRGKEFLNDKYLKKIDAITPNLAKSADMGGMVAIKGGKFSMGGDHAKEFEGMPSTALAQADEFPKHEVQVSDFWMDDHEVTVGEFREFVNATGYITVAEQDVDWDELKKQLPPGTPKPDQKKLKAGALVFHLITPEENHRNLEDWWTFTTGANWKNPDGKNPELKTLLKMPVTQVSWYDAMAYAKWAGKRLPTEAEFEYALRSGKQNNMYPWGNEKLDASQHHYGNFLQGEFPISNTGKDGYVFTSPVKSYPPNDYGLFDLAGNVWEWTNDWYSAIYYKELADKNQVITDPKGPEKSFEVYDPNAVNKTVRGGSFLCSDSWCSGYRNSRRMRLSPDTGMQHLGFRCVRDLKKK